MGLFKRTNENLNEQAAGGEQSSPVTLSTALPARSWKLTGGSSDYYKVEVQSPTTGCDPYTAECNDIIEALNMNFAEGNAFKAIWRKAAARAGNGKPGNSDRYDSEKVVFFGLRMLDMAKLAEQRDTHG